MNHIIVGTAGHIDHGKTTLIKALTGRDTDTTKEEKERGISINLGFTYFDLPSGKRAGIVDVPGHERFIKNMLAGVSGIDIVLLVIAADEGVMPQTREHFNIISLLDVKKGIVVVTKKDLVDDEWLDVVKDDINQFVKGTFMENASVIPVSSKTGEGIKELTREIDILSEQTAEKDSSNCFRLPVDRVFTVSGFGTVVTGTLISGTVSEGDRVQIYTSGIEARVKNIQVHDQSVNYAAAGQRVAVNLSNIKVGEIKRGDVIGEAGCMDHSMIIDCRLNYLKDAPRPLENRDRVRVYHGTRELLGRVMLLDRDIVNPGDTCIVQLRLESPIAALRGDKYVIRTYSPMFTIGGGTIIIPNSKKIKSTDKDAINEILLQEKGNVDDVALQAIYNNSRQFPDAAAISKMIGKKENETLHILSKLLEYGKIIKLTVPGSIYYIHYDFFKDISQKLINYLNQFHSKNPLKYGVFKEEIKSRLFGTGIKQKTFDSLLALLEEKEIIRLFKDKVSLNDFKVVLSPEQEKIKAKIINIYADAGINAVKPMDVISAAGGNANGAKNILELLIESGELVRISDEMVILSSVYSYSVNQLKIIIEESGEVTLSQFRDIMNTSRKYAVTLLEYFDQIKLTKRLGDKRVLY